MGSTKLILVALAAAGVLSPAAVAQAPELFTYSPEAPLTNEVVTFTAQTSGTITWDLDGDGACDDAAGPSASRSFDTAGDYDIRMCVNGDELINKRTVTVLNRVPVASFSYAPAAPMVDEAVTVTSTSTDADGPIVAQSWDLDGDNMFDDAGGATAGVVFAQPGTFPVALQVVDRDGATAQAIAWITVAEPLPEPLSPLPTVRFEGSLRRSGAILRLFMISAPQGVQVAIRCRGGGCPYGLKRFTTRRDRTRVHSLERRFRAGAVIEIRATKQDRIGKYVRLRVRRGIRPARVDRCLMPGVRRPVRCPSGPS